MESPEHYEDKALSSESVDMAQVYALLAIAAATAQNKPLKEITTSKWYPPGPG